MWYKTLYRSLFLPTLCNYSQANFSTFTSTQRHLSGIQSTQRRNISSSKASISTTTVRYGNCELDSHADSTVAGNNCVILNYTGKECDVSPYREDYESIKNVPIVNAATAWQSPHTGQTYILILNEAIWMGEHMDHTLINPNQLRHFGTRVQDDPTSSYPLSIITEDESFSMELAMTGTIVYAPTFSPSAHDLEKYPHIELSSPNTWDPKRVTFPKCIYTLGEMIHDKSRHLSALHQYDAPLHDDDESIFNLDRIQRKICSLSQIKPNNGSQPEKTLYRDKTIDPGSSDAPDLFTFQSSDRHTDVNPQQLSERWGISITTAFNTLQHTMQKFLRSSTLPLSRRYRADWMFARKTLSGVK